MTQNPLMLIGTGLIQACRQKVLDKAEACTCENQGVLQLAPVFNITKAQDPERSGH